MYTKKLRRFDPMKRCIRRRVFCWPRKEPFRVSWGGFFLTIRLFPYRGWQPIAFGRIGPPELYLWEANATEGSE